jgi:hypothetical protein
MQRHKSCISRADKSHTVDRRQRPRLLQQHFSVAAAGSSAAADLRSLSAVVCWPALASAPLRGAEGARNPRPLR